MSGISKNKKSQIFCFKSDENKIEISFLFNIFKIKKNVVQNFEIWKIRNRLKWKKNQISNFAIFFSGVIVVFVLKMTPIFDEFSPITQKIKIVEFFYYFPHTILYSTFRIIHKMSTPSEGGGRGYHELNFNFLFICSISFRNVYEMK